MKMAFLFTLIFTMQEIMMVFDFKKDADLSQWNVVNDVVMGGNSEAGMLLNDEGNGVFAGIVSLENNGGFSSVRYNMKPKDIANYKYFMLRVKGDGKRYQFRVKTKSSDYYSYIYYFETNGEWQDIRIEVSELLPQFRGRSLNLPVFPGKNLEELGILIGNKKAEAFRLEIDKIYLEK